MKIKGLQKVTLIDYPGEIACTLFLFGCNFRCGFCHNPELVIEKTKKENTLPEHKEKEIIEFLKKRKKYLNGVCITGGEPLISLKIEFVKKIKSLGYKIKIDTNGSFPEKLRKLINGKLIDYIAMDIKSDKESYNKVVNSIADIKKIEESIALILNSGLNYEFRTTILKKYHKKENIKKMIKWLYELNKSKKIRRFCLQAFENHGKLIDSNFELLPNTSEEYLKKLKKIIKPFAKEVCIRC